MQNDHETLFKGCASLMQPEKILFVEDDQILCDLFLSHTDGFLCQVTVAHNGIEAIEAWERQTFSLTILDLKLDGPIDGLAVFKRIMEIAPDASVCIVSNYIMYENNLVDRLYDAGFVTLVPKNKIIYERKTVESLLRTHGIKLAPVVEEIQE